MTERFFDSVVRFGVAGALGLQVFALNPGLAGAQRPEPTSAYSQTNQQDKFLSYVSRSLDEINRVLYFPAQVPSRPNPKLEQLRDDQQNLLWLLDRQLPIIVIGQPDEYFPTQKVIEYARVFRAFHEHFGLEALTSLTIYPDQRSRYIKNSWSIELGYTVSAAGLAHELGHLAYNLGDVRAEFVAIRGYAGPAHENDKLSHVRRHSWIDDSEDFATIFAPYLAKRPEQKRLLMERQSQDQEQGDKLAAKVALIKRRFHGQEFSGVAIPIR